MNASIYASDSDLRPNTLALIPSGVLSNKNLESYCDGIRECGGDFHYIDPVKLYRSLGKGEFENYVSKFVTEKKIECIFIICDNGELTVEFIATLSKLAFVVIKFFDTTFNFDSYDKYLAQGADLVLVADSYLATYKFADMDMKAYCPFTLFDPRYYKGNPGQEKNIDVSFIGELCKDKNARREFIQYAKEQGVTVATYGNGGEHGVVDFPEMIGLFQRSKINLNFTGMTVNYRSNISKRTKQCKGRPIEVALAGGFTLSEYAPGMEKMFDIGTEIDVFHTKEELVEKIQYYLTHDALREAMAARAYQRALAEYDVKTGFRKIYAQIDEMRARRREKTIYADEIFIRGVAGYRMRYLMCFIAKREWRKAGEEIKVLLQHKKIFAQKCFERIKVFIRGLLL